MTNTRRDTHTEGYTYSKTHIRGGIHIKKNTGGEGGGTNTWKDTDMEGNTYGGTHTRGDIYTEGTYTQ